MVFEIDDRAHVHSFQLLDPFRIIIDISLRRGPRARPVKVPGGRPVRAVAVKQLAVKKVVIDPGHGGRDSGAIGRTYRLEEKRITLAISLQLAKMLKKRGFTVLLTRKRDKGVSLEGRMARANAANADLFVSIHCNASVERGRNGIEVYYLNLTNDHYAKRIAARENARAGQRMTDLQFILADLTLKSHVNDSIQLASLVIRRMHKAMEAGYSWIRQNGVKPALFYVLVGAKMPAILVEAAYISNRREEKFLRKSRFRKRLAQGILQGILEFVRLKASG